MSDHGIEFFEAHGYTQDIVVFQGFKSRVRVEPTKFGWRDFDMLPFAVNLHCIDESVCVTPAVIDLDPYKRTIFEISGGAPGLTEMAAVVPALPDVYSEIPNTPVRVIPPKLSFNGFLADLPQVVVPVGSHRNYVICLAETERRGYSYSSAAMQLQVSSSNPAVAKPLMTELTWEAGEECITVEAEYVVSGEAELTFSIPGVPALKKSILVEPKP